ncbi:DUF5123 domain-containing protein [Flavobacterium pectinovorum]|uniref:DUF5123 domain-containing protein n=1 Tax=Flavobacterium pectinovorum TaxID=29533 RepID=UPI001FAD5F92|nr:DUF5123 domain-containing protein [Flavobacterium pectinovorum]MCI9845470.1 DUF5123 domain-containing protein [Flavobacterium pectinovorum]
MKNKLLIFKVLLLIVTLFSCEKDYNDWDVDSSHDRLFKSIIFETSAIASTSVEIKFTKSISATKYVFEFSKDNLEFKEIVKTVELSASNLLPFANSSDQAKIEYRQLFDELEGTTGYSVRMKSIDETTGKESKYNQVYFLTPAEQLFKGFTATSASVNLNWNILPVVPKVTNISLYNEASVLVKDIVLTDLQKNSGKITFDNLTNGTNYIAKIFNGTNVRGILNVKTTGLANSTIYNVLLTDTAGSIGTALQGLVAGGATDITVEFAAGTAYTIGGDITIPTGVNNIAFVGSANENGILSSLSNARIRVQTKVNDIVVQNLRTTSSGSFFIDLGTKTVHDVQIEGCNVSQINSIVRVSGASVVNNINVNNCFISQTGDYGVLNVGAGGTVNSINVSNCTLTEISTRFADVRVKTSINFRNITCVNITKGMGHLWNFDNNNPVQVSVQNCIIAGPNGGMALNSTSGTYSNISISYTSNYKTKDIINGTRLLTGITDVPLPITDFFVDPANGDFHIKPGIGFAGTGVSGDPRWF